MDKKVSVIIPVYNVEAYVEECLVSILKQTMQDWEMICVDDGGTDQSMEIVEKYAAQDERIRIVHQENAGLSAARNHGLRVAEGKYILFLDSDDYLKEETLECLLQKAEEENLDELFYSASVFYESEEIAERQKMYDTYYKRVNDYLGVWTGRELFVRMNRNKELKPSACLQLLKREFLSKYNLDFYEGIIHEDNLFTTKCLTLAERTGFVNKEFYMRRVREDSIMTNEKGFKNAFGYYVTVRELIRFAEEQRLNADPVYFEEYQRRLCHLVDVAASYVNNFREIMPECLKELPESDRCLFELLIINGDTVRRRIRKIEQEKLDAAIEEVKSTATFRVGKMILALPRKLIKMICH